jgi:hypothetical protein
MNRGLACTQARSVADSREDADEFLCEKVVALLSRVHQETVEYGFKVLQQNGSWGRTGLRGACYLLEFHIAA